MSDWKGHLWRVSYTATEAFNTEEEARERLANLQNFKPYESGDFIYNITDPELLEPEVPRYWAYRPLEPTAGDRGLGIVRSERIEFQARTDEDAFDIARDYWPLTDPGTITVERVIQ